MTQQPPHPTKTLFEALRAGRVTRLRTRTNASTFERVEWLCASFRDGLDPLSIDDIDTRTAEVWQLEIAMSNIAEIFIDDEFIT